MGLLPAQYKTTLQIDVLLQDEDTARIVVGTSQRNAVGCRSTSNANNWKQTIIRNDFLSG